MNIYFPNDENIRILGRHQSVSPLPLFWHGSGLEFDLKGSELYFNIETDYDLFENWIRVELNGAPMLRTSLQKGKNRIFALHGSDPNTIWHVRLLKETQPMPTDEKNCFLIESIETDGEILPAKEHTYRIEFAGDSLTSGEGLRGSQDMQEWVPMVMSTEGDYASLVGEALDAEIRFNSQGGWGVYHSWDGVRENNIPDYFEKLCGVLKGQMNESLGAFSPNDFSSWQADAVVVNLGTNDESGFSGNITDENASLFKDALLRFYRTLRRVYPHAYILHTYGMCNHGLDRAIADAVSAFSKETGDTRISFLPTPTAEDFGSRSHPGLCSHKKAAEMITEALKQVL